MKYTIIKNKNKLASVVRYVPAGKNLMTTAQSQPMYNTIDGGEIMENTASILLNLVLIGVALVLFVGHLS